MNQGFLWLRKKCYKVINNFKNLNYATLVTGGHLSKTNDTSLKYIRKDNIKIDEKIKFEILNKNSLGHFI